MSDHATALALARALFHAPGLTGCHVYAMNTEIVATGTGEVEDVEEIQLPCIRILDITGTPLCAGTEFSQYTVTIAIASQADDEKESVHKARVAAVQQRMADTGTLAQWFLTKGVTLCGRPAAGTVHPEIENRAFRTPLAYVLGVKNSS